MTAVMTTIVSPPVATSTPATTSQSAFIYTVSTDDASVVISEASIGDTIVSIILDSFQSAVYSVEFSFSLTSECGGMLGACYWMSTLRGTTLTTRSELLTGASMTSNVSVPATITSEAASTTSSALANNTAGDVVITVVAGAVGGCSAFFIAVGAVILFCVLRRRRRRRRRRMEASDGMSEMSTPADDATEETTPGQTELDGTERFEEFAEKEVPSDHILETPNTKTTNPSWTSLHTELQTDHVLHELEASPTSSGINGAAQHMSSAQLSRSLSDPTMGGHSPHQWKEQP